MVGDDLSGKFNGALRVGLTWKETTLSRDLIEVTSIPDSAGRQNTGYTVTFELQVSNE